MLVLLRKILPYRGQGFSGYVFSYLRNRLCWMLSLVELYFVKRKCFSFCFCINWSYMMIIFAIVLFSLVYTVVPLFHFMSVWRLWCFWTYFLKVKHCYFGLKIRLNLSNSINSMNGCSTYFSLLSLMAKIFVANHEEECTAVLESRSCVCC